MDITRHNYEEYFILYIDNELNAAERKAVELFVQENADLEEELIMLQQSVLRPDEKTVFGHKDNLLKDTATQGLVNEGNYESYFVMYGDDELNNKEKDLVEQFVYKYPQYQVEFEFIQQARLFPETVSFPDKNDLYRTEKDDRVVPFPWWRIAAAAIVLLVVGTLGWNLSIEDDNIVTPVAEIKTTVPEVKKDNNKIETTPVAPTAVEITKSNPPVEKIIKKSQVVSNISQPVDVQPKTEQMKPVQEPTINDAQLAVKPVDAAVDAYTAPVVNNHIIKTVISEPAPTATAIAAATPEEMFDNKTYVLNTSVKKTPLRGFFRKVSRVVDKATSFEVSENERGGVRIANFEVALK